MLNFFVWYLLTSAEKTRIKGVEFQPLNHLARYHSYRGGITIASLFVQTRIGLRYPRLHFGGFSFSNQSASNFHKTSCGATEVHLIR